MKFSKWLFRTRISVQYPSDPSEAETALEAHKSLVAEVNDMKPRVSVILFKLSQTLNRITNRTFEFSNSYIPSGSSHFNHKVIYTLSTILKTLLMATQIQNPDLRIE